MEHLKKFYSHAADQLDQLLSADYDITQARQVLQQLDRIPEELHQSIKVNIIDRLKGFYEITKDHLENTDYKLSDWRIIDHLAVKGQVDKLKEHYGIKRVEGAQGQPKPYEAKETYSRVAA